jgi:hypothetical protein
VYVSEGSGENIFIVRNNEIKTTPLTSILEGITRDSIIQIAKDLKIPLREKRFTRDEVYIADEAFFTGTAAEVTPIRELDGRKIGTGKRGRVTEKLQKIFFDIVKGKNKKYESCLQGYNLRQKKKPRAMRAFFQQCYFLWHLAQLAASLDLKAFSPLGRYRSFCPRSYQPSSFFRLSSSGISWYGSHCTSGPCQHGTFRQTRLSLHHRLHIQRTCREELQKHSPQMQLL